MNLRAGKCAVELVRQCGDIYSGWPKGCVAWKRRPWLNVVAELTKLGVDLSMVEVGGCPYDLRDEETGLLMKKSWLSATTDSDVAHKFGNAC